MTTQSTTRRDPLTGKLAATGITILVAGTLALLPFITTSHVVSALDEVAVLAAVAGLGVVARQKLMRRA